MNQSIIPTYTAQSGTASEPLSAQQLRFWVLDQLEHTDASHNVRADVQIRGKLDLEALEKAIHAVLEQHDVLRSRFILENGEPRAITDPAGSQTLPAISFGQMPQAERRQATLALAAKELHQAFDLEAGPLYRVTLYELGETEHLLNLTFHKIVCDPDSAALLMKGIAVSYDCVVRNASLPLSGPQYSDYRTSQAHYIGGSQYESDLAYWKDKLEDAPAGAELSVDHPRPLVPSFRGAEQSTHVRGEFLADLRRFSSDEQSNPFLTLLSAFFCVLTRYTGNEDIVIGTEVPGRDDPHMAKVMGAVSNQLVLRADCSGNLDFRSLCRRISQVWAEAQRHQAVPFGTLLEALNVPRDLSRNPLFQIAFNGSEALEPFVAAGLQWEPVRSETESEILDLSVNVTERDQEIELRFCYSTDLFEHATITRLVGHFSTLLQAAIVNPEEAVSQLPILTAAEQRQILVEWNDTRKDFPGAQLLHRLVEEQAGRTPNAKALICGDEAITYRDLNERANQLANYLLKRGAGAELLVGIHSERVTNMLVGILGILKSGSAYVPLDPNYPKERIRNILEDSKAPLVVTQESIANDLPDFEGHRILLDADWPAISQEPTGNPLATVKPENLAYVLFTSGSTGRPKGVAIEHHSAATFVHWALEVFTPQELSGVLLSTSMCFDLSIFEMFVPLSSGGTIVIAENALHLPALPAKDQVTLINTVPSAIAELLNMGGVPDSVKTVNLAGEALTDALVERIYANTKAERVYNLYGPTEDTTYSTYTLVSGGVPVTVGRPIANSQAHILDAHRQPVPIGVAGELYLAGQGLARGYYGRPDLTEERFVPNPFSSEAGTKMYRTGDLTRFLPDGNIEYLGRIDHQVKIRGFRIELGEIEVVLADYPAISQGVVIVREDTPGEKYLTAYCVLASDEELKLESLRSYLATKLPEFMVPAKFVVLRKLPMTTNGKVDRKALPAPQSEPHRLNVVAPQNDLEALLTSLFQEILNLKQVSVLDDFFELGGHSLTAARLLSQIHKKTGRKIPLSALFRCTTVRTLAQLIEQEQEIGGDPVMMQIQQGKRGSLPFFAIVPPGEESLGYAMLARHMGLEQTVYKIQGHAPITGGKRPYTEQEMRDLTEEYVAAMRKAQPRGPYCLGGLCDGTHIAEQIVLSLEAQGEEVGLFAIFDTWVMQHSQRRWLWKIHYYGQRLQELRGLNFTELVAACREIVEGKIQVLTGKKSAETEWPQTYWPDHFKSWQFDAPVILFKRPKQPFYYVRDSQMGWGARTRSGVEVHEVDFHHMEILREPHLRIFADGLAEFISRLGQRRRNSPPARQNPEPPPLSVPMQHSQHGS